MKQLGLLGVLAALGGCKYVDHGIFDGIGVDGPHVTGNGVSKEETRTVGEYDRIVVGSAFEVEATEGKSEPIKLVADENIMPLIKTEVKDRTLHIRIEGSISNKSALKLSLSTPKILGYEGSGATRNSITLHSNHDFELDGSGASTFSVVGPISNLSSELSGASHATLATNSLGKVKANLSGASTLTSSAKVDSLDAELSGASKIDGKMTGQAAKLELSGASFVRIGSFGTVQKDTSGASHVDQG